MTRHLRKLSKRKSKYPKLKDKKVFRHRKVANRTGQIILRSHRLLVLELKSRRKNKLNHSKVKH